MLKPTISASQEAVIYKEKSYIEMKASFKLTELGQKQSALVAEKMKEYNGVLSDMNHIGKETASLKIQVVFLIPLEKADEFFNLFVNK